LFGCDVVDRVHDERSPRDACGPALGGRERRDRHPHEHEDTRDADERARHPVPPRQAAHFGAHTVQHRADREADALAERRD
jgi:hypothetical protein